MDKSSNSNKNYLLKGCFLGVNTRKFLTLMTLVGFLLGILPLFRQNKIVEADLDLAISSKPGGNFLILQGNSLFPISSPINPDPPVIKKIPVVVTAYSSTPWETDDDPYLTAAGTRVREGIVANNLLPFGTKIRIPELYGDRIFVVEDRMSWEKGKYQIDIWFPDYWQALSFGAKRTYIEILEG